jgi:hypothetical protein
MNFLNKVDNEIITYHYLPKAFDPPSPFIIILTFEKTLRRLVLS